MTALWTNVGFIRWPLLMCCFAVVGLTLYSTIRLYRPGAVPDVLTRAWLDAILFWGGFAMLAGVLGTLLGMVLAAASIEAAGEVSTSLVWGGMKVALLSAVIGTMILAASSLSWFALQMRWRVLESRDQQPG